jgi:hypothetical protein
MRNLRMPTEPVRHLPLKAFLHLSCAGRGQDPLPHALFLAAVLFTLSAVFAL